MEDTAKIIGERIYFLRHRFNLSKTSFARDIGVDPATVRNWEKGKYYPNGYQLPKIADRLHVSIDYLFGRER